MISFACKKCNKRHSRPDTQAGSMVFCDCGTGLRVPWSSTVAPDDPMDAVPVPTSVPRPRPIPARREETELPAWARRRSEPEPEPAPRRAPPRTPPPDLPLPSRDPMRLPRRVRANLCFNHDEDASVGNCVACKLPFCANCLVTVRGETLCGPCKNFKVSGVSRTTRPLPLAIFALIMSLVSAPVMLVLSLLATGLYTGEGMIGVAIALCVLALVLPTTGLILSTIALRRLESKPQFGGRGLACGGLCTSLVGIVWTLTVATILIVRASGS